MTTTPVLSLEEDFNGNFQPEYFNQFTEYVNNSGQINATMEYILSFSEDDIVCQFDGEVTPSEEILLKALASNFVYVEPIYYNSYDTFVPRQADFNLTSYQKVASYPYPGTTTAASIQALIVVSNKDSGVTNYTIRLEDVTHSLTICEATFTNNVETTNTLATISNLPSSKSIFEIQIKKTGGTGSDYAHIQSISVAT